MTLQQGTTFPVPVADPRIVNAFDSSAASLPMSHLRTCPVIVASGAAPDAFRLAGSVSVSTTPVRAVRVRFVSVILWSNAWPASTSFGAAIST